jgi:hypothetical protein
MTEKESWFCELNKTAQILLRINEALIILDAKRVTVEEKMISSSFHQLSITLSKIIACSEKMIGEDSESRINGHLIEELRILNAETLEALDDFLKAARYDLNFLEQYYEHKFLERLHTDFLFVERAGKINDALESIASINKI